MTAPGVAVEVGFGSTWLTEPDDITWTDVTDYALQGHRIRTRRGASSARGVVDVGSCELALMNDDRRFDPTHAAGPHFGELLPGVPCRVRVLDGSLTWAGESLTWDGVDLEWSAGETPIWRGTVARWPQRYDRGNTFAWVPVEAFDGFDKLSRAKIPQAAYPLEVLADDPVAYWRLDERDGNVMLDASESGFHGIYDNPTLGEDPLILDGTGHAARFEHVGDNRGQFKGQGLPVVAPVTLEAWVQMDRDLTAWRTILIAQRDNAFGSGLWLLVAPSTEGSPNGELVIEFRGLGGFYKARGHTRIDDGEPHHVVMTMASAAAADIKLYVDGEEQTKTVISGATGGTWDSHLIWCVGNVAASAAFDFGMGGYVDEVAVYDTALSAARVLAHYEAGSDALAGQRTDERIDYVIDTLGWPVGLRDIEEGNSVLGPATFEAGDAALAYLRLVTASEDGLLFIATNGTLRFLDRFWRYLDPVATVSQFTFSDVDGDQGYAVFDLDLDDELLVNTARCTRRGGTEQFASDAVSVALHGEAEKQQNDLLLQSDAEVLALAQWTVATQGAPLPRVPKIRVPLHRYSEADQASVLGLDMGHRVTCERTPQGVGSAISLDLVIDGIAHDIGEGEWWWEAYVSPAPDDVQQLFLLSGSLMSGTDVLAY